MADIMMGVDVILKGGELSKLRANPGDTLVLMLKEQISEALSARLRSALEAQFPLNRVFVLGWDMRLGVIDARPAVVKSEQQCISCIHYHVGHGECRRYPPQTNDGMREWPFTGADDYCGEWEGS